MDTPVATIADALIAFILSLLRDPEAVEEFNAAPHAAMASNGLEGACAADVKAVAPVIIDHPDVTPKPDGPVYPPEPPDEVIKEISRIVNQFTTIDNRATVIDQSTNQNIWAKGDVTQIFDQEAVVAVGDDSVAAGDDAAVDNSENEVTVGDVAVGNTSGSHNTTTTGTPPDEAAAVAPADPAVSTEVTAVDETPEAVTATTDAATTAVDDAAASAEEPDVLMTDLTATDSYDTGEALVAPEPEPYPEEPVEEQ
ncbi:MAG TPA: IniB N-terminal domain-containing protein [Agromyces sp.]|nr:IniB N-terminal domain-containing protein [Agromyces sp.]